MRPPFPPVSERDIRIVSAQLGRQARERLYYVMPGEVSYLVIDDRTEAAKADATAAVSAEVTESKGDWMRTLLDSVMTAGLAPAPTDPADAPADTPADAPVGAPAEGGGR